MKRRFRLQTVFAVTVLLLWVLIGKGISQEVSSQDVAALLKRIDTLEQRVKTLEAEKQATVPVNTLVSSSTDEKAQPAPDAMSSMAGMDMGGASPEHHFGNMNVQGFADVGWIGSDHEHSSNSFYLGQMNLFITSRLSNKSNIIAETVFESDSNNAYGVELERLLYNYSANDYLNISVGRFHSAIGYYNTAYHHSTWMQTAMDRPQLFDFEDDGGILPIHNVGVSVTGKIPSGGLGLHYIAELGNGRTSRNLLYEPVQNIIDENNRKSTNLAFYARPERWRAFQAGFSWYNDNLMPDGMPRIHENIFSVHAVYQNSRFEFLNEAVLVRHSPDGLRTYNTPGGYSQIAHQFHQLRPYFRYQYLNANSNEPIYSDVGLSHGPSAGLRVNVSEFAAFKVEYDRMMYRDHPASNSLGTQLSFAF